MSKIIVGSYDTWHTIRGAGSSAPVVEKEIGARLTVRLMSVLLWIAFSFFFWSLLLPYSIFTTQAGISNLLSWGVLNAILGFSVLFASLHLHVVFLRLMLLRPRVFGGKLDILDTIYQDDI